MKKILVIGGMLIALLAVLDVAGYAYAQTNTPPAPFYEGDDTCFRSSGGVGGRWGSRAGMMGGRGFRGQDQDGEYGPLHEYMINALAKAFGLTPEELEERHQAGETLWELAAEQGISREEFQAKMLEARTEALNQAVIDGVITQEQADWMLTHMSNMSAYGYGQGSGHCGGYGLNKGNGRGGRWTPVP